MNGTSTPGISNCLTMLMYPKPHQKKQRKEEEELRLECLRMLKEACIAITRGGDKEEKMNDKRASRREKSAEKLEKEI